MDKIDIISVAGLRVLCDSENIPFTYDFVFKNLPFLKKQSGLVRNALNYYIRSHITGDVSGFLSDTNVIEYVTLLNQFFSSGEYLLSFCHNQFMGFVVSKLMNSDGRLDASGVDRLVFEMTKIHVGSLNALQIINVYDTEGSGTLSRDDVELMFSDFATQIMN
eukprot:TRINITY_DN11997_c0_g1_i1.p1 TRINITY_DN11997_c0_g1~~TRINITY_DN11997_c0_g1_i1.p1  ORF type:complete len:163 (-),score=36.79 TRINITY_DN11997_c0_g1_i1:27-515(-)